MKRILQVAAVVIVVIVIGLAALIATVFRSRHAITDGFEVAGVRIVKDGFTSVAVIPLERDRVALIDAGSDKAGKAILADLERRGLGADAVTAIFLTHGHPDHTGALAFFPQAEVMALEAEVPLIEGRTRSHGPLPRLFPAHAADRPVTRALHDGETVTLGSVGVRVFAVPGHTQGSAAYLADGVLFMGDAADATSDGKLRGSAALLSDSAPQDRASLVALEQRLVREGDPVKAIEFAHSGVLVRGLEPLVEFAREKR